ncbi:MAG TPA: hypothetical protein PLK94_01550 [Alphaproteobacteria bacterium]|nr:hypothetical protein [Alphaproteobacteria bacterium]HPQ42902.1 hypothetical protein [Syntrophales bacterium]
MKKDKNRLVVGSRAWADTIPEWLLEEIKAERLMLGMASIINPEAEKVGDAEVCAYLMTASLEAPLGSDYTSIYVYLTAKLMERQGKDIPDFAAEQLKRGLSSYEEMELRDLRYTIYQKRGGDIDTPILNVLRELKKGKLKEPYPEQMTLFEEMRNV